MAIFISGSLMIIASCVEYYFFLLRGDVFSLDQLVLVGEATDVVGSYQIVLTKYMWVAVVVLLLCTVVHLTDFCKMPGNVRVIGICFCIAFIYIFYVNADMVITEAGGAEEVYIAHDFYNGNGYLNGLLKTAPHRSRQPENYSEEKIRSILGDSGKETLIENEQYPDIIFIQNESLYYLEHIANMQLTEKPLTYLKTLQNEYISGYFISPMAGGGTCNVEYEVLTGYPYSNTSTTPYVSLIKTKYESIVSLLNTKGYYTLAMHPNDATFFNRQNVYNYMQFEKIIFPEDMDEVPEEESFNGWAGDSYLYRQLIAEYENRDTDRPFFAHVVTTQNHGGYSYVYDEHGIKTNRTDLDNVQKQAVETYANLEKETDESLEELIEYFQNVSKPVIIVFWGDHCPSLYEFGINEETFDEQTYIKEHDTPLLIWNNYGLPSENLGYISAYKVGAYALKLAGITDESYFDYLNTSDVNNFLNGIVISKGGHYTSFEQSSDEMKKKWDDLWLLQYDRMFGKQYSLEE